MTTEVPNTQKDTRLKDSVFEALKHKIRRPPITFPVKNQWGGFCLNRIKSGEIGYLQTQGFYAFDEGLSFCKMLENLNTLVHKSGCQPSMVDRLFVIFKHNETTSGTSERDM